MSGFFSLGQEDHEQDQQTDTNYSLFPSKNEEIYKGFEQWQHCHQLHVQKFQHQNIQDVGFSIRPSSSSSQNNNFNGSISNIGDEPSSYRYKSAELGFRKMMSQGRSDGVNCLDCGNQAKKGCEHMRCRTCCKSQGFPCQTHVKSTWIPAAKRRERQQQQSFQHQQTIGGENLKRMRENPGRSGIGGDGSGSGGGFELGHFPSEVNYPAVFRCVRVSGVDDAEESLAYRTAVNIGGHVYKGILYDQGPENWYHGDGGKDSSGGGGAQQHPLDMIAPPTSAATTSHLINFSMLEPSIYPTQDSGFLPGAQFFPPPRP